MTKRKAQGKDRLGKTRAFQFVSARFGGASPPSPDLPSAKYVEVLNEVEPFLGSTNGKDREALLVFLYQGAIRHSRWASSNIVADNSLETTYARFVDAFAHLAPANDVNLPILRLWRERDRMYRCADGQPTPPPPSMREILTEIDALISEIPRPANSVKLEEFAREEWKVGSLLKALKSGEVRTEITTSIPQLIVLSPHEVTLDLADQLCTVHMTPRFRPHGDTIFGMEPAGVNTTPTRWPDGETEIQITVRGLVDCRWARLPLQAAGPIPPPVSDWPQVWVLLFEVVERLYWSLSTLRAESALMHPLPR